jgi:hypothetical protein
MALACTSAALTALILSCIGCAQYSAPAHTATAAPAPDPNSFQWQTATLSASGRGSAPSGTSSAQKAIASQNAARVAALKDLKIRIRQLPIGTEKTVGYIMDNYLGVRRAIEKQIQQAETVGQQELESGEAEVQVQTQLQPIADILKQNNITPTEQLPKAPSKGDEMGVPALT